MDILHVYTDIEGEKVDIALDPELEKMYCKNSGQKRVIPANISGVKIILCREGSNGY